VRSVRQDESMGKARCFCRQPVTQNTTPIMTHYEHLVNRIFSLSTASIVRAEISFSHRNDELGQGLKNVESTVARETVAASEPWQIHSHQGSILSQNRRFNYVAPYQRTVWPPVKEDDKVLALRSRKLCPCNIGEVMKL
jgi:hypothetical protein